MTLIVLNKMAAIMTLLGLGCAAATRMPPLARSAMTFQGPSAAPAAPTMDISVIVLGGDPTGHNDSATAFDAAIAQAVALADALSLGAAGSGGVTIDLGGGTFLLSRPVSIRGHSGGWTMSGGTLLADPGVFPASAFLLDVENSQNLGFSRLTFDNQHVGGGINLDTVVQISITACFFLHYSSAGIHGNDTLGASHELMVDDVFIAEYMWGEAGFDNINVLAGVGIYLETQFYDSQFTDIIIRCTRVGIVNRAGANLFHGLHIYATCNKDPDAYNVSVGMLQAAWGQTRISHSYFDDSPLVVLRANELEMVGCMVYGLSGVVLAPQSANETAAGLMIHSNIFSATSYSGAGPLIQYDARNGSIDAAAMRGVAVEGNSFTAGLAERRTRFSVTVAAAAAASVAVPGAAEGGVALRAALLGATFNATVDLRDRLLVLPPPPPAAGGAAASAPGLPFDWQVAASPVLARMQQRPAAAVAAAAAVVRPATASAAAADAFGGVIAQLQATAVLTALTAAPLPATARLRLALLGSGLAPVWAVYPTETAGVLAVSVGLQTMPGGAAASWLADAAAVVAAAMASDSVAATAGWEALVTISVDQALPLGG